MPACCRLRASAGPSRTWDGSSLCGSEAGGRLRTSQCSACGPRCRLGRFSWAQPTGTPCWAGRGTVPKLVRGTCGGRRPGQPAPQREAACPGPAGAALLPSRPTATGWYSSVCHLPNRPRSLWSATLCGSAWLSSPGTVGVAFPALHQSEWHRSHRPPACWALSSSAAFPADPGGGVRHWQGLRTNR